MRKCEMGWTGAQQQHMKKKAKIIILMLGKETCKPGKTAYPRNWGTRILHVSTLGVS